MDPKYIYSRADGDCNKAVQYIPYVKPVFVLCTYNLALIDVKLLNYYQLNIAVYETKVTSTALF